MARLIRITADPAWGWCAGLRHPPEATYPAEMFTQAQLAQLRADPALTVEEPGEESSRSASAGPASPPGGADTTGGAESAAGSDAQGGAINIYMTSLARFPAGGAEIVAGSDAGSKPAGDPEDVDASGGGDGAVPNAADGAQAPDAQPGAATPPPGPDAQSEGAAGSNPRPDGDGQPGDQAGPGAAASNTAAPVTAGGKSSRNRKAKS